MQARILHTFWVQLHELSIFYEASPSLFNTGAATHTYKTLCCKSDAATSAGQTFSSHFQPEADKACCTPFSCLQSTNQYLCMFSACNPTPTPTPPSLTLRTPSSAIPPSLCLAQGLQSLPCNISNTVLVSATLCQSLCTN